MRSTHRLLGAVLATLLPASASAQGAFEGTVTYRMSMEGRSLDAKFMSKGQMTRMEMAVPGMPGPVVVLTDNEAMVSRTVMASMGVYLETDLKRTTAAPRRGGDAVADSMQSLGTHDEIAGIACENFRITQGTEPETEICGARGMGWFMGGMSNPMGGRGTTQTGPNWGAIARQFPEGLLPLRVRTKVGDAWTDMMTAIEVVPGSLGDDLFQLPAGLRKMSMPGGR